MNIEEYKSYDATGLANLVRAGQVKPIELLNLAISVIDNNEKEISALTTRAFDYGKKEIENGKTGGYFNGVPFMLKDLNVACQGLPTTMSNKLFKDNIPNYDSDLINLYKKSGLVVIGMTKTPELALSLTTEPILHGPTRNPLNHKNSPGGSSGGSAAAIAAGYVPMAHATDGGGSIRVPASLCGLVGLKPSRGRISAGPQMGEALGGMATSHCLSKSVRDSAALLEISKKYSIGDPYCAPNNQENFLEYIKKDPGKLKIGFMTSDFEGNKISEEINSYTIKTAKLCEDFGHIVEEIEINLNPTPIMQAWKIIPAVNLLNNMQKRADFLGIELQSNHLEDLNWAWLEEGRRYTAIDYLNAINTMHSIGRRISEEFVNYDLLLTPTVIKKKLELGTIKTNHDDIDSHLNYLFRELAPHLAIFNQTGGPAISLPLCKIADNLPLGMHFAAKIGDEGKLISLASQFEKRIPWAINQD